MVPLLHLKEDYLANKTLRLQPKEVPLELQEDLEDSVDSEVLKTLEA